MSVGGLLALALTGRTSLAGLPQTASVLGAALAAVPLSRLAARGGRRRALATGFLVAAVGATTAFVGAASGSFPLLLVGAMVTGVGGAAGLQARFAATDGVADDRRGLYLSIVVWSTTIGAVVGPNLISAGTRLGAYVGVEPLAGPWLFGTASLAIAGVLLALLLPTSRVPDAAPGRQSPLRATLRGILSRPDGRLSLLAISTSHAVMVGIMAMTSVHLKSHGSSFTFIGFVISAHVAGMFALAPLFGWLTDRLRPASVIALGATMLLLGAAFTAASGWLDAGHGSHRSAEAGVTVGLVLVGLGWSATTIAGATLVAKVSHESAMAATDVQGASDLVMGVSGATAGVASGAILAGMGYMGLALVGAAALVPLAIHLARNRATRSEGGATRDVHAGT